MMPGSGIINGFCFLSAHRSMIRQILTSKIHIRATHFTLYHVFGNAQMNSVVPSLSALKGFTMSFPFTGSPDNWNPVCPTEKPEWPFSKQFLVSSWNGACTSGMAGRTPRLTVGDFRSLGFLFPVLTSFWILFLLIIPTASLLVFKVRLQSLCQRPWGTISLVLFLFLNFPPIVLQGN